MIYLSINERHANDNRRILKPSPSWGRLTTCGGTDFVRQINHNLPSKQRNSAALGFPRLRCFHKRIFRLLTNGMRQLIHMTDLLTAFGADGFHLCDLLGIKCVKIAVLELILIHTVKNE